MSQRALQRQILAIAIPSIVANIATPVMGLVDTAVTGHLGSEVFIAAIAVGSSLFNFLYWPMGFLRMGTSGLSAQLTGRGDRRGQSDLLYRGLIVALSISLLIILLRHPLLALMLRFMSTDASTSAYIREYFDIVVCGAPAVLSTLVMTGWLLGCQSAKMPMAISIAVNVVNIAVSPVLAFVAGWELKGVACGTLIAQWVGAIIGAVCCLSMRPGRPSSGIFRAYEFKRFASVNTDIFFRSLCLMGVTLWFTREGARQGELVLAANAILMQFFILFSYVTDGFAYAAEALTGRFEGSDDAVSLHAVVRALIKWGFGLAMLFSVLYFVIGDSILELLTDQTSVKAVANDYLPWVCTVPLAGFLAFTWDGVFIGVTMTRRMLLSMIASTIVFFVSYFALKNTLGNHALWLAFTLYLLVRGLLQSYFWNKR